MSTTAPGLSWDNGGDRYAYREDKMVRHLYVEQMKWYRASDLVRQLYVVYFVTNGGTFDKSNGDHRTGTRTLIVQLGLSYLRCVTDYYDRDLNERDRQWQAARRRRIWLQGVVWLFVASACLGILYYFYRSIDITR